MRRLLILFSTVLLSSTLHAQFMVKGEKSQLWPLQIQYKNSGWYFGPGLTRTFTNGTHSGTMEMEDESRLEYTAEPRGRWGVFLEGGRWHLLQNWLFFEHFDYGLSFKQFQGRESFQGTHFDGSNGGSEFSGIGEFNSFYLSANANLNHWTQVTDQGFIQASLGLNVDYRVIDNTGFEGTQGARNPAMPPQFLGQAHFKLGYGWKVSRKWYIIPTLETPVLNAYPWEDGKSTMEVFSSRYRPVILSVRFFMRQKLPPDECPPVKGKEQDPYRKQEKKE